MTSTTINDRGRKLTPTRRALAVAGSATLALSLLISIGPALAASGTVKIHDALTSAEQSGNSPHVCQFYAAFYASDPVEAGSWELIAWEGERPVVASGLYDTTTGGVAVTPVLAPEAGHYRFEWTAGDGNSKHKMLWVDADCETEPSDESDPSDQSEPSDESDPSDQSEPSDESDPSDQSEPSDQSDPSDQSEPSDQSDPSDQSEPSDQSDPSGEANPTDGANPSDDAQPSDDPNPSNEQDPDDGDTKGEVEQGVKDGNSGGTDSLPDTSIPVTQSGVLAAIGLMLILAAHAGSRRERQLPAA